MFVITPFYAALLSLLYVGLSINVIKNRLRFQQSLGVGREHKLERAVRAHGNFAEYVPLVLIMMAFLEINKETNFWLHFFGIAMIVGRLAHVIGISIEKAPNNYRLIGMMATFTCLIGLSIKLVITSLQNGF